MLVFVAFALKLVIVSAAARLVRPRCTDALAAFLAAWVVVTGLGFAAMFALSAAEALTRTAFWIALPAGAIVAAHFLRRPFAVPEFVREALIVLALFGAFWIVFALRSLLFQDFTFDAQSYGLARIGLWMNYANLFVHMPSPQVNVFANEWNGELFGLFYGLATGDLQGPIFANVEVLLVTFLACGWLARLLGASWNWAFAVAGLIALCPACLGLASTVKGDLLAIGAFVLALGWLLVLKAGRGWFAASMLIACLALAVGAKVTAAIPAAAIGALAIFYPSRRAIFTLRTVLAGSGLAGLFLSRYAANLFVYGDPFMRVPDERLQPGIATLLGNLDVIWRSSYAFAINVPGEVAYASHLSGGFGLTGFALLAALAAILLRKERLPASILGCLAIGLLISCVIIPARVYGLRYLAPAILAGAIVVFAKAEPRRSWLAVGAALIAAFVNITYLTRPGEVNGNGTFTRALRELPVRVGPLERAFLADETRRNMARFDELRLDRLDPLSFVIFQDWYGPALPFVGSYAQHRIVFAGAMDDVPRLLRDKKPDFAVITKRKRGEPLPGAVRDAVARAGFVWIEENFYLGIAARADRPEAHLRFEPGNH